MNDSNAHECVTVAQIAARLHAHLKHWADEPSGANIDRGRMAALRKGLRTTDGWTPSTASIVDSLIPRTISPTRARALYEMAVLYATHPHSRSRPDDPKPWERNYAITSALRLGAGPPSGKSEEERRRDDRKITYVLDATRDEVFTRLRKVIPVFLDDGIGIDWVQLAIDLDAWDRPNREVQRRWARGWWSAPTWMQNTETTPVAE